MTKIIDFYFDFISPYSFIANKKINLILSEKEININYKPILLGGLHKLGEITAPAFNEKKMKNMRNDCELIAKKNNFKFRWNEKFPINSLYLMRGYLVIENKLKRKFYETCFDAYWKDNIDISSKENIEKILFECGIDKEKFYEGIENPKIKDELKNLTYNAFHQDIFGAPTFVVNKKIFWGQDRLDYALDEYTS